MTASLITTRGTELLDRPDADPRLVEVNLRNIARANRWLGGRRALAWGLHRLQRHLPRGSRLSLLDIGTGYGDLPLYAARWGRRHGLDIVPIGLERIPVAARIAAANGLPTMLGCASAFPVRPKSVDLVLVSQVVHHFTRDAAAELLRACDRLARRAVIVVDLLRSRAAALGFHLGGRLLAFDGTTMADGLTSIERGLSAPELAAVLRAAGVTGQVRRVAPFRLVATWRTEARP